MNLDLDFSSVLAALHLQHLEANWTTFLFIFFLVVLFMYFGKRTGQVAVGTLSVYVALAIVNTLSIFSLTAGEIHLYRGFAVKLASFVLIAVIVLILISRFALRSVIRKDFQGKFWPRMLFAFLSAGFLTASVVSFLPQAILERFSALARVIFSSGIAQAAWMILPILVLLFVKEKEDD